MEKGIIPTAKHKGRIVSYNTNVCAKILHSKKPTRALTCSARTDELFIGNTIIPFVQGTRQTSWKNIFWTVVRLSCRQPVCFNILVTSKNKIQLGCGERSGAARDGTPEPVSRDQILRRGVFSVQLTTIIMISGLITFTDDAQAVERDDQTAYSASPLTRSHQRSS